MRAPQTPTAGFSEWLRRRRAPKDGVGFLLAMVFHLGLLLKLWPSLPIPTRAYLATYVILLAGAARWQRSGARSYAAHRDWVNAAFRLHELGSPVLLGQWARLLQESAFIVAAYEGAPLQAAAHSALVLSALPFLSFVLPFLFGTVAHPFALPLHCLVMAVVTAGMAARAPMVCGSPTFRQPLVQNAMAEAHEWLQLLSLFAVAPLSTTPPYGVNLTTGTSSSGGGIGTSSSGSSNSGGMNVGGVGSSSGGGGGASAGLQLPADRFQQCQCRQVLLTLLVCVGTLLPTAMQAACEWRLLQGFTGREEDEQQLQGKQGSCRAAESLKQAEHPANSPGQGHAEAPACPSSHSSVSGGGSQQQRQECSTGAGCMPVDDQAEKLGQAAAAGTTLLSQEVPFPAAKGSLGGSLSAAGSCKGPPGNQPEAGQEAGSASGWGDKVMDRWAGLMLPVLGTVLARGSVLLVAAAAVWELTGMLGCGGLS